MGCTRIHGERLNLGIDVGGSSVSKYMVRGRKPPSPTWRTFQTITFVQLGNEHLYSGLSDGNCLFNFVGESLGTRHIARTC